MKFKFLVLTALFATTLVAGSPARAEDPAPTLAPLPDAPTDPSADKAHTTVTGSASGGVVTQTNTGTGAAVNTAVRVTRTDADGNSQGVSVTANGVVGSSAPGAPTQLPNLTVSGRYFFGDETPQPGQFSAVNYYAGGMFDRNTALGRLWDGRVYAGAGSTVIRPTDRGVRTTGVGVQAELGVAGTGNIAALPYLQVRAQASLEQCLKIRKGSDKDQVCAAIASSVALGLVQVSLDVNAGAEYRRVLADDPAGRPKVVLFAGPTASASTLVDLNGAHGSGMVGLVGGVRAW